MNDLCIAEVSSRPSVMAALRATFRRTDIEGLEPLRGGLSKAALFKLAVGGRHYVLRYVSHSAGEGKPSREFDCMMIAAERGIAPRVLYANADEGVCITDFVKGLALVDSVRSGGDCIDTLAGLIRRLHDGPMFPAFMTVPTACHAFHAALVARRAPSPFSQEHFAKVEEIRAALVPHVVEKPCHNDLNPGNVLFDGTRMWLIDWEAACVGDPFHDLAAPGVFILRTPEQRLRLLRAYLGREPDEIERARLVLSRTLALTFYALAFANIAVARSAVEVGPSDRDPSPTGEPARFGEGLALEAQREITSAEHASALAVLR